MLMKRSYIFYSILITVFISCKKENMDVYKSGHYIQFTNSLADTTNLSFFFYPGKEEVTLALPLRLIGTMPEGNLQYQLKVDPKVTTAEAKHYSLPASFDFRQGLAIDTAYLTIKKSPELATTTYLLAIDIASTSDVQPGQTTYARRIFRINDMVTKPSWWDSNMDRFYLGVYTERKFRKFMEFTGVGDLSEKSDTEKTELIKRFKYFLIQMKDAGTPVLEDDGSDMLSTIPIAG
ncbi:uncharacterized protein DUF4843 [Pseudobacter ginsenosidimutans]|uniref:Uncharacterized protein DUF4843 n=2 Tax=Pseudobacter ginsenosidimutans TaxID=661488 RepID=A0A4Q7MZH8_9BACT|nr:uncharacterized protein DUF4843 [Pseudobacter ginsenosidimutans]